MNLHRILANETGPRSRMSMICGFSSGPTGPSAADLAAQSAADRAKAQAEADAIAKQKALEAQRANDALVAEQATQANADAARRAKNRSLLLGVAADEASTSAAVTPDAMTTDANGLPVPVKKKSLLSAGI